MIDLYYWSTPNGNKVSIFLGETATPYLLVPVNIGRGDQLAPACLARVTNAH
jgi:GST-like protein